MHPPSTCISKVRSFHANFSRDIPKCIFTDVDLTVGTRWIRWNPGLKLPMLSMTTMLPIPYLVKWPPVVLVFGIMCRLWVGSGRWWYRHPCMLHWLIIMSVRWHLIVRCHIAQWIFSNYECVRVCVSSNKELRAGCDPRLRRSDRVRG